MMQLRRFSVSIVLLSAVTVALSWPSSAEKLAAQEISLKAFKAVQICTPLATLIKPAYPSKGGKAGQYSLKVEGESSLLKSLKASVENGVLHIEANASFKIQADAKLTVTLPYTALKSVSLKSASHVYIAPGFESTKLDLIATSLGGSISASELKATQLALKANGLASITAAGKVEEADISADGGCTVRLAGLQRKTTVSLTGVPTVAIETVSPDVKIKGTSQGSKVTYNQGKCSVKGRFSAFGPGACSQDASLKVEASPAKWTCNATSTGVHMCTASGGSSSSSFSSVGTDCQTMTWTIEASEGDATEGLPRTARRLRESSISGSTTSSTGGGAGGNAGSSTYTYTSNTPNAEGTTSQTVCNFVNNVGSCQVNGTPVPVRQYSLGAPAPSPGSTSDILNRAINAAASNNGVSSSSSSSVQTSTSTSGGGTSSSTVCSFINGIGGCSSG